ncbi:MAG: M81 family metallopeptidase [bacterium]|nr:M81 family metallopeptidase [bacterium]
MNFRINVSLVLLSMILGPLVLTSSATETGDSGAVEVRTIRIGVASFSHETCTFCPNPTTVEDWEFYGPPLRGDDVMKLGPYIQGFARRSGELVGVDLVGISSPRPARGGSSGSWITREAFDKYSALIVADLKAAGKLDGVYLALHGAMAVTGVARPESELVKRVRTQVGDIPIVVTLDLHANEDHTLSEVADVVLIVKRYPHYDSAWQGERAARLMARIVRGEYTPTMATRKPGVITPSVFQGTGVSPAMDIMERARRWENGVEDAFVSVAFGFAYADVPDVGATVMVVTNDDKDLAQKIADDMSDYIWRRREGFAGRRLPKTAKGVKLAIAAAAAGNVPVVVADHADRTGNASHILEELIQQEANGFCITTIADERAVANLKDVGASVGDAVSISVGGWADRFAGNPVKLDGVLDFFGPYRHFKDVAVIRFGTNNRVIVTPRLHQVTDVSIFEPLGISLDELKIIVLKSRVHFRRGYHETGIAGAIIEVDAPGLGPADLTEIEYKNVPKDLYPIHGRD